MKLCEAASYRNFFTGGVVLDVLILALGRAGLNGCLSSSAGMGVTTLDTNSESDGAGSDEARRMAYGNMFQLLLERVSDDAGWVLQLVHDTRGIQLSEMKAELVRANIDQVPARLAELETLGLVVCVDEVWKTTWTGAGVTNWRTQLHCRDEGEAVAEPREGENGHQPGPECSQYRAALFAPGYCWCCRPRKHHSSEAIRAAERLLKR